MKNKIITLFKVFLMLSIIFSLETVAYASSQPELVTKSVKLFDDATSWLMIIIPAAATLMMGFFLFQKTVSDDQAQTAELNKKIKTTLISAVIGVGVTSLVKFILAYFQ